jgi:hypothetical protein
LKAGARHGFYLLIRALRLFEDRANTLCKFREIRG